MKKAIASVLALAMILGLAACASAGITLTGSPVTAAPNTAQAGPGGPQQGGGVANQYFKSLNADKVNITGTGTYTVELKAKEGWQFDIADNTDVTGWIVTADNTPAFTNTSGVAFAVNGEDFTLNITIDASKIRGFNTNGSGELYVRPTGGNPLVVEGENHGMYNVVSEKVGVYAIPKVSVNGTIEGENGKITKNTVTVTLEMDGLQDSLINSGKSVVKLLQGDGYYLTDYSFPDDRLTGSWKGGKLTYTIHNFSGEFSPLGGDGNGNYWANIGVSGITYNGLPLSEAVFRVHMYSYGRTFTIETNGSLINDTQPLWSTTAENGIPVLCDPYPDFLTATWPIGFDASALTQEDFSLTMLSDYGDTLALKPGTDFTVSYENGRTEIMVNYMYWANIPVYKTLRVDVKPDHLTWNTQMYTVTAISHDYEIASVYAYYNMSGGMQGTQKWTYYGVDGLTSWEQAFKIPTYTLSYTDSSGVTKYYTENADGSGRFTDAADEAKEFDSRADNKCQVVNNTGSFERVYDQTAVMTVDGTEYTFNKVYGNADNMPLAPADCTGITAQPGYVIGDSWEMHGRWPWQTFINQGYLGGSK